VYEFLSRGDADRGDRSGWEAVGYHQGSTAAFWERYTEEVSQVRRDGVRGLKRVAPDLLNLLADARTLRRAWDFLTVRGGAAPGPNGLRYRDLTSADAWDLCRCLARAIRTGSYRPGPERTIWIAKTSGNGRRPLALQNIEDRVVQRALVDIVQPLLDPLFSDRSFGYRPRFGHWQALALAERLTLTQRRPVWVCEDIRDAFQHVPVSRLLQVVRKLLPAADLLDLLGRVVPGPERPGLRQGGPLSPLLLNVYLHHFLDRPWCHAHPELPLLRLADDLLILCRTRPEARQAYAALQQLLEPAGLSLKGTGATSIHGLEPGDEVDWLGFRIRRRNNNRGLSVGIAKRAWRRLDSLLALAHTKPDAPLRATSTIKQWLDQRGPCYACSNRVAVCQRILTLARELAFEEVPSPDELRQRWQRAAARWGKLRKAARAKEQAAQRSRGRRSAR
jgi:RNA-directed DNA polymerase